ncbi:sphingomyelin phosphodiesterase [Galdieria sulphuraria]|uniref:sphingomyelin phosphodiesterase n=1 Tax=Galdieria sulphuraria TaxID=130081 RepID=M2W415_GALSU|nr:sphingomyelin phosphodiesterase [Galdieria sulphuraria]EME30491.1 sphingomyelin phosphodiesterase [Galdieria sulphuraria]|eukprot:XP_005707011.1 sphingomyelin phosphodiesterase [Galdieria sulphuraria]
MPIRPQESYSQGLRKRAASLEENAQRDGDDEANKLIVNSKNSSKNKVLEANDLLDEDKKSLHHGRQPRTLTSRSPRRDILSLERHRTCSVTGEPPVPTRKFTASPLLRTCCLLLSGSLVLFMTSFAVYLRNYMAAAHSVSFVFVTCLFFGPVSFAAVIIGLHGCCAANVSISKASSKTIRMTMAIFLIYLVIIYIFPFDRQEWYENTAKQAYNRWMHSSSSKSNNTFVDPQDYFLSKFLESYKFRILSYNIFIRPPGVTSNGNDYKDERLVRFLSHMMRYDIICLQELFTLGSDRWQALTKAARIFGFYYEAHLKRNLFSWLPKVVDGGVTILSKFPIVATDSIFFKRSSYSTIDCIVAKGVLYAKIELPFVEPRYLHLFSTHLQAGDEPLEEMMNIKLTQLEQAREFIYSKLNSERKELVVFCGDLNVNGRMSVVDGRDSKEYFKMMQLLSASSSSSGYSKIPSLRWKDVIRDSYQGMHPVTVGDADVDEYGQLLRTWELQLASKGDRGCRKRLDYILFDPRNSGLDISNKSSSKVETFFVSELTGCEQTRY